MLWAMSQSREFRVLTFLWTLSFLKISVASNKCWFSKILRPSAFVCEV